MIFIHAVFFEIEKREVSKYRKDSLMWAGYAKRAKGFISYSTFKRYDYKNQYVSVYRWDKKSSNDAFMRKFHGYLVKKSKARVKPLGYYDIKAIDNFS
jgi:heme-degrading monooxygenase HmoA